jgi:glycosyltransferase involved in cell wall biosynthesis
VKFSFYIVNYNRLYYLRACVKSLQETTSDYEDKEFICIDDDSKEPGTKEYLNDLEKSGWKIIHQEEIRKQRGEKKLDSDRNNFLVMYAVADALQLGMEASSGDIIVPLHGDSQFIRRGWLHEYNKLFSLREDVGAAGFDAQRKSRLDNEKAYLEKSNDHFFIHHGKLAGIVGAGDFAYRKSVIERVGGFSGCNEDEFVERFKGEYGSQRFKFFMPSIPVSAVIHTDARGTNARVRGNKRYGDYWRAEDDLYYRICNEVTTHRKDYRPLSIEEVVSVNGNWELPVDKHGDWKKNPIDVENSEDFDIIY